MKTGDMNDNSFSALVETSPAMPYRHIEVSPIAGALGAEVQGADLRALDDAVFAEIHQAFLAHQVLFFQAQDLSPDDLKALGRRFGDLYCHPYLQPIDGHPEVVRIVKEPGDTLNFGGSWHADLTYLEKPMLGAVLHATEVPRYGGDTLFANMYLAYETLSDGMKRLLDRLTAVHSARHTGYYNRAKVRSMGVLDSAATDYADEERTSFAHPAIRVHPETGRKALFVNALLTVRFGGMTEDESKPILDFLFEHLARPEFTCRFRWEAGSVAIWDNRCVQHFALNDYPGQRRVMQRVVIAGDRPYGPS